MINASKGMIITDDKTLAGYIYKNASMGVLTLPDIYKCCTDEKLLRFIKNEYKFYVKILKATKCFPKRKDIKLDCFEIIKVKFAAAFQFLSFRSNRDINLTKMLCFGTLAGIIDIKRRLNDYSGHNEKLYNLGKKLFSRQLSSLAALLDFI